MNWTINNKIIVTVLIILLAISPSFALGAGNRNLLLIGVMSVTPLFILRYPIIIPKIDIPLICLCAMLILFPLALHPETMRWSTILYSCMFCLFFMFFVRVFLYSNFTTNDFLKTLKGLIYAYCIVLIIQQICVLTGLPIFNISNYNPMYPWKLNSLMSEPSHSARIIPLLMYIFVALKTSQNTNYTFTQSIKEDKLVWIAFMWPILTMGSATAFIFMWFVFLKFTQIKKIIPSLLIIGTILIGLSFLSDNKSIKRVQKIVVATLTFDEEAIIKADHSASFRIVPTIQGAKEVGFSDFDDWFGHGVDADQKLIKPLPSVTKGSAGAFYLWINWGIIVAALFWWFTFKIIFDKNNIITSIFIWFLIPFITGVINSQYVWFVICIWYIYKQTAFVTQNQTVQSRRKQ